MGFFRNRQITNYAYQASYKVMKLMSSMRITDAEMTPSAEQAIEALGDELAVIARDYCSTEQERACVIKGLEQGLKAYGLSQTSTLNIVALLTQRVMAGKPDSALTDAVANYMEGVQTTGKVDSRIDAALKQVSLFMDASLMLVDNATLNRKTPKIAACFFFAGATDFLSQHYKLSDDEYLGLIFKVLVDFGVSEKNARLFIRQFPQMASEPFGREAMIEGGRTIQRWLSGEDTNAPLRLTRLVNAWADESL